VSLYKAGYAREFSKSCPAIPYNTPACMHVLRKLQ